MMLSDGAAYFLVVEICAWSVSACADSVAICDVERAKNRLVLICMGLAHVEDRLEDFARDLDHAARGLIGLLVAQDRKSVGEGKSVSVRVELGGRSNIKKKKKEKNKKKL